MQRRRLLTATLELVYERGVQAVTVALISDRAGVSRKTFYDIFGDRETCLQEAFEDAVGRAARVVERAVATDILWRMRVRAGLGALLCFLDEEPVVGQLLIVGALASGAPALSARRRVLARVMVVIDEGRTEGKAGRDVPPLTAEGVVGAVLSVIHARMLDDDPAPLVDLVGPLMALIVHPYLGAAAAKRELVRPVAVARRSTPRLPADPFKDLPIRLTYRTAQVLASIAEAPGSSSKQIATASGVADEGQMSRLLSRLERVELIRDTGEGPVKGEAKAWSLTSKGLGVQAVIAQQTGRD